MIQTQNNQTKKSPKSLGQLFLILVIVGIILAAAWVAIILFYQFSDSKEAKFFPEETLVYAEIKVDSNETLGFSSFFEKLKLKSELEKAWQDDFPLLSKVLNLNYKEEIEPGFKAKIKGGLVRIEEDPLIEGLVFTVPLGNKEKAIEFVDKICEGSDKQTQNHEGVEINAYPKSSFYYFFENQNLVTATSEELIKLTVDCDQGRHSSLNDNETYKRIRAQEDSSDIFVYFNPQTVFASLKNQFSSGLGSLFSNYLTITDRKAGLWINENDGKIKIKTFVDLPEDHFKNLSEVKNSVTELLKEVPQEAAFGLVGSDLETKQDYLDDQIPISDQSSVFGDLNQFLSDSFREDLKYFFSGDYLVLSFLKDGQLLPALVFNTPNSLEASEKMKELEGELEKFLEIFFSQSTRSFILPDDTTSKEIIESSLSFENDLIEGIKIRKIDFGSGSGLFYGFSGNKLFISFDRDSFTKIINPNKQSITTDDNSNIWEKGIKKENCILNAYFDLDQLVDLESLDLKSKNKNNSINSSKLFYSLFKEVVSEDKLIFNLFRLDNGILGEGFLK